MGGLVSRWMIEREGGNESVEKLVMLGTPNAGSPWSTVEDWVTTALSVGLNSLTAVTWPTAVLGLLVDALEKADISLDQMKPGSDFLKPLATSGDPGIPYTIIAGNTSIIPAALQTEPGADTTLFERLWLRIKPKNWLHTVSAPVFFGQPNDVAVTGEHRERTSRSTAGGSASGDRLRPPDLFYHGGRVEHVESSALTRAQPAGKAPARTPRRQFV